MSRSRQGRDIYFLAHSWYIMKTNHNLKMFTFGKQVPTSQINLKGSPWFLEGWNRVRRELWCDNGR